MDTNELLKKVRKIEIKTRGLSNHIFSGEYHTAFKGRGMSFSEVREYQFGDDIRSIDWNVTARFNHPFVKVFEEERELTVMLIVDVSKSQDFGTVAQRKIEILTEIAAILSFSAITNNDKVGILFFSDRVEKFIPPKKGKSHILRIIRELIDFHPEGNGTDIAQALRYFNNVMKKRCITFLISDFFAQGYEDALLIAKRKHDLVGIRLFDPLEAEMPSVGLIQVKDAETGQLHWVDTSNKKVRTAHAAWFLENADRCRKSFLRCGADLVSIDLRKPYIKELIRFFKNREARR